MMPSKDPLVNASGGVFPPTALLLLVTGPHAAHRCRSRGAAVAGAPAAERGVTLRGARAHGRPLPGQPGHAPLSCWPLCSPGEGRRTLVWPGGFLAGPGQAFVEAGGPLQVWSTEMGHSQDSRSSPGGPSLEAETGQRAATPIPVLPQGALSTHLPQPSRTHRPVCEAPSGLGPEGQCGFLGSESR